MLEMEANENFSKKFLTVKDYLVSGESFELFYNSESDLLKTFPVPDPEKMHGYYESDEYHSHSDEKGGWFSVLYRLVKKRMIRKKLKLILKHSRKPGALLDVGAGTGDFLTGAKERGWEVHGIEPAEKPRKLAAVKGIELADSFGNLKENQFDVITLWHVLEHIPDLDEVKNQLVEFLKPEGILILAVPNFKSFDANYYKEFWAGFDVPRHIWHFSKPSIINLFQKEFENIEIKGLIFDSFYVSLLSEKYKSGKSFSAKALGIGLLSNLKAKRTKEYSSLVYCFRKRI